MSQLKETSSNAFFTPFFSFLVLMVRPTFRQPPNFVRENDRTHEARPRLGLGIEPLVGKIDDPLDLSHVEFFLNRGHFLHGAGRELQGQSRRPFAVRGS
jgi:hypothetical protein